MDTCWWMPQLCPFQYLRHSSEKILVDVGSTVWKQLSLRLHSSLTDGISRYVAREMAMFAFMEDASKESQLCLPQQEK